MSVSMRTALLLTGGLVALLGHIVLAVTFLVIVSGALYGAGAASALGDLAKHRRSVRPDRPVRFGECPPDVGRVLSTTEFERRCDVLLTPPELEVPEPPDPLPMGLRDPGLTRTRRGWARHKLEARVADLEKKVRCMRREPWREAMYRELLHDARRDLEKARKDAPTTIVADRQFEGHTHCPEGHIGVHHIGEAVVHEGESMIRRECRFEKCGAMWLERSGLPAPEPKGDESFADLMKTVSAMPAKTRDALMEKTGSTASPVDENEADWRDLGREVRHAKDREFERRIKRDALRKEVQAREREIAKAKAKAARQSRAVGKPVMVTLLDAHYGAMGKAAWHVGDGVLIDVTRKGITTAIEILHEPSGWRETCPLVSREKMQVGDTMRVTIPDGTRKWLES